MHGMLLTDLFFTFLSCSQLNSTALLALSWAVTAKWLRDGSLSDRRGRSTSWRLVDSLVGGSDFRTSWKSVTRFHMLHVA